MFEPGPPPSRPLPMGWSLGGAGPAPPLQFRPPSGVFAPSPMCQMTYSPLCSRSGAGLCAHVFTATELNANGPADVAAVACSIRLFCFHAVSRHALLIAAA